MAAGAPQPQDLLTVLEAREFLNMTGTSDDAKIQRHITRASDWIEQMADRKFAKRAYSNLRFTGPRTTKLYLPAWPIDTTAAITVVFDKVTQTVWRTEADGDPWAFDVVVASDDPFDTRWGAQNHFYRQWSWDSALNNVWDTPRDVNFGQHNVLLSCTAGYSPIPEDLKQAAAYLVQKLWRDQQKQATGVVGIALQGGGSIQVPEPFMPREVRELVSPYRRQIFAGA